MANEVSYASLLSAGGRVARILSSLLHTNLYDPTGLRALMTFIPYSPMGSSTMNVTKVTRQTIAHNHDPRPRNVHLEQTRPNQTIHLPLI